MRKNYLDNIRWFSIVLVVIFHVFFYFNNIGTQALWPGAPEYTGNGVTFAGVYQYFVYPWFMTLLFVVAGISAYHALQHTNASNYFKSRCCKILVPCTLGIIVFGWISGIILASNTMAGSLDNIPIFIKYFIYTLSGTGALWFCQVLFIITMLLLLIRGIDIRINKREKLIELGSKADVITLIIVFFLFWGSSKILNTPVIDSYRFGIYTVAFILGYYVFSQDKFMELIEKVRFLTLACGIAFGIYFIFKSYGTYYASSALLSSWYANAFTYFMVLTVLGNFKKYADMRNDFTAFCSKISFPVYILHIPVMLITIKILQNFSLPIIATYIILGISGLFVTPIVGLIIQRIPVIRFIILGMKKK